MSTIFLKYVLRRREDMFFVSALSISRWKFSGKKSFQNGTGVIIVVHHLVTLVTKKSFFLAMSTSVYPALQQTETKIIEQIRPGEPIYGSRLAAH